MVQEIAKAAIKYKDKIYTGFDHGECFEKISNDVVHVEQKDIKEGFITSDNGFVDRKLALKIALNAKQLRYPTSSSSLISEDLHIYWLNQQEEKIKSLKSLLSKYINLK